QSPVFAKGGSESYLITRTAPDHILRHDISDEQLTMMQTGNRTMRHDIMWAALGIAMGALVPALQVIAGIGAGPSDYLQFAIVVIFALGFGVFAVMALLIRKEPDMASKIAQEIRDRSARVSG